MIKAALVFVLLTFGADSARAIDRDKALHFAASGAIASASYLMLRQKDYSIKDACLIAVGFSLLAGVLKETVDDKFDKNDLLYDASGALFVPVVVMEF